MTDNWGTVQNRDLSLRDKTGWGKSICGKSARAAVKMGRMTERTRHQEKIIKNYYENRDSIGLQKAQEAVTELYLSEGKKRAQVWKRLTSHLAKIGLKEDQIAKLQEDDNPEQLAKLLEKYV